MLVKNKEYEIEIEDLNNLGYGVGHVENTAVFVSGAVDGDRALARIILVKKNYAIARCEKILRPSEYRSEKAFCTYKGCGGCAYADIEYSHELELKRARVEIAFRKSGMKNAHVMPVFSTYKTEHYRNKAQYPITQDKNGEYKVGFYAPKSHRVVSAIECPLQPVLFSDILKALIGFFKAHKISAYSEETGKGLLRHIYLRSSEGQKECTLVLVINGKSIPNSELFVKEIREKFPQITSVMLNVNTENTNVVCGDEYITLYGDGYLLDTMCGVTLKISPASFYQVNRAVAEAIYTKAKELAELKGEECLLDLYCGIGSIGLSMADSVSSLVGIEVVPQAVECAKENALRNNIKNAHFFCADASGTQNIIETAEHSTGKKINFDTVILDPPRKGCSEELLEYLVKSECKKIVYISCNPDTLARDAFFLTKNGFSMSEVYPYDMFPKTGHVESVACFTRGIGVKKDKKE